MTEPTIATITYALQDRRVVDITTDDGTFLVTFEDGATLYLGHGEWDLEVPTVLVGSARVAGRHAA